MDNEDEKQPAQISNLNSNFKSSNINNTNNTNNNTLIESDSEMNNDENEEKDIKTLLLKCFNILLKYLIMNLESKIRIIKIIL